MTVPTEAAYAQLIWTGVETSFTPGFTAEQVGDVAGSYLDVNGLPVSLARSVNFNVSLDGANNVTVTPIALQMPAASAGSPVTLIFQRNTAAIQGTDFQNLNRYNASVHQTLFDRAFRRDAKGKLDDYIRGLGPVDGKCAWRCDSIERLFALRNRSDPTVRSALARLRAACAASAAPGRHSGN